LCSCRRLLPASDTLACLTPSCLAFIPQQRQAWDNLSFREDADIFSYDMQGSLFGPYTPLQQLDILADHGTRSYIVGSTNSLLLQQKDRYSDILVNLDDDTVSVSSPSLRLALQLSVPDRRWIDGITQEVNDTWDAANPSRPSTMGFRGSEEFIRFQFEEYLQSLISATSYHNHMMRNASNPRLAHALPDIEGDPSADFNADWVEAWSRTENYKLWLSHTDADLFNMVEPRHPCAGGLTIEDVQRRFAVQVQDLHLDERFAQGKEVLGRNFAAGREKASSIFNKLYADMEARREAMRKRAEEGGTSNSQTADKDGKNGAFPAVDLAKAQQTMQSVGVKAGALVNSWAAWAGEKRKTGWGRSTSALSPTKSASSDGSQSGGWGFGSAEKGKSKTRTAVGKVPEYIATDVRPLSNVTRAGENGERQEDGELDERPSTQRSYSENIFDATSSEIGGSPAKIPGRPLSGVQKPLSQSERTDVETNGRKVVEQTVPAAVDEEKKPAKDGDVLAVSDEAQ
jgi:hypothetical protein